MYMVKRVLFSLWILDIAIIATADLGWHNYGLDYESYHLKGTHCSLSHQCYSCVLYDQNNECVATDNFIAEVFWDDYFLCTLSHGWEEPIDSSICYISKVSSTPPFEHSKPMKYSELLSGQKSKGYDLNSMSHIDFTSDAFQNRIILRQIIAYLEYLFLFIIPSLILIMYFRGNKARKE